VIPPLRVGLNGPIYSTLSRRSEASSRLSRTPARKAARRENPDAFGEHQELANELRAMGVAVGEAVIPSIRSIVKVE
jgi:hypothetical protein